MLVWRRRRLLLEKKKSFAVFFPWGVIVFIFLFVFLAFRT